MWRSRRCETCGWKYSDIRTGETFASVYAQLRVEVEDSSHWRIRVCRSTVLGRWHEIKRAIWHMHLEECEGR